jgi:transposase-like protein
MVHQGQRLALRLEPRDHALGKIRAVSSLRLLTTRVGVLERRVPRTRCGKFQTVLKRYERREPLKILGPV